MTPARFLATAIDPALALLPLKMASDEARALEIAICQQESELKARRQRLTGGRSGRARSYAQFERIAIEEVLTNRLSRTHAAAVCSALDIEATVEAVYRAIEFNDVLCAAFTRLNLWRTPHAMPGRLEVDRAWHVYEATWAPGKPRPAKWPASYAIGWRTVEGS